VLGGENLGEFAQSQSLAVFILCTHADCRLHTAHCTLHTASHKQAKHWGLCAPLWAQLGSPLPKRLIDTEQRPAETD